MNDKLAHALGGAAIGIVARLVGLGHLEALALVALVGAGKEIVDLVGRKGTPDPLDLVATVAGGLCCLVL